MMKVIVIIFSRCMDENIELRVCLKTVREWIYMSMHYSIHESSELIKFRKRVPFQLLWATKH